MLIVSLGPKLRRAARGYDAVFLTVCSRYEYTFLTPLLCLSLPHQTLDIYRFLFTLFSPLFEACNQTGTLLPLEVKEINQQQKHWSCCAFFCKQNELSLSQRVDTAELCLMLLNGCFHFLAFTFGKSNKKNAALQKWVLLLVSMPDGFWLGDTETCAISLTCTM